MLLIILPVKAEVFSSDGTYFFPTNISEKDCYFHAKNNAIKMKWVEKLEDAFVLKKTGLILR